jgi:hypothetical protein
MDVLPIESAILFSKEDVLRPEEVGQPAERLLGADVFD